MMAKTLEGIKNLFDTADEKKRSDYLLDALTLLRDEMRVSFDRMNGEIKMINQKCLARRDLCEEAINAKILEVKNPLCEKSKQYLTKAEAKVYGFLFLAFSVGIGIGAGILTWHDLALKAIP